MSITSRVGRDEPNSPQRRLIRRRECLRGIEQRRRRQQHHDKKFFHVNHQAKYITNAAPDKIFQRTKKFPDRRNDNRGFLSCVCYG